MANLEKKQHASKNLHWLIWYKGQKKLEWSWYSAKEWQEYLKFIYLKYSEAIQNRKNPQTNVRVFHARKGDLPQ